MDLTSTTELASEVGLSDPMSTVASAYPVFTATTIGPVSLPSVNLKMSRLVIPMDAHTKMGIAVSLTLTFLQLT